MDDLDQLLNLHRSSKVTGILSHFSDGLLKEYFYVPLITQLKYRTLVAVNENKKIVGVASIKDLKLKSTFVSYRLKFRVGCMLIFRLVETPELLLLALNFLRMQNYIRRYLGGKVDNVNELQLLLVDASQQSKGIGTSLMAEIAQFETNLIVQTQNPLALKFYESIGFRALKSYGLHNYRLWVLVR